MVRSAEAGAPGAGLQAPRRARERIGDRVFRFLTFGLAGAILLRYAISPYEQWHQQSWAASFFLLALALILSISARLVAGRLSDAEECRRVKQGVA